MTLTPHLAALAPLLFGPSWGGVAVFHGLPGGLGSVVVHDEVDGSAHEVPELADVRLKPIDVCGRTGLFELAPDRARYVDDVPWASRVALPAGRGSIYGFSRSGAVGPTAYGYFHVDSTGQVHVLIERPALGDGTDPFLNRIAVAPDGGAILVATLAAAGGDLFEIDLATRVVVARTATLDPMQFGFSGLALSATWGCAIDVRGVLRFDRSTAGDAELVPFACGVTPPWFERQVVTSTNGAWAATIAGESGVSEYVFVFGPTGSAVAASELPDRIASPGFLPNVKNGPWLAVSDDGRYAAWRSEISTSGYGAELFVAHVPCASTEPPVHVTGDALFDPWLDEIGQFVFGGDARLRFLAGDRATSSSLGIAGADAFEATFVGSTLSVLNLTATSGQPSPPFTLYGSLTPERVWWMPQSQSFVLYADDGQERLLVQTCADSSEPEVLFDEIATLDVLGASADALLLSHFEDDAPEEPNVAGISTAAAGSPDEIAELDSTASIVRSAVRADGTIAVLGDHPLGRYVWRIQAGSGDVERLTSRALVYGPSLSFSPGGALVTTIGEVGSPSIFVVWPDGEGPHRLLPGTATGFVLPGI